MQKKQRQLQGLILMFQHQRLKPLIKHLMQMLLLLLALHQKLKQPLITI